MNLRLEHVANGRVQIIRCHGSITAGQEVEALQARFGEVSVSPYFVLNLSGVTYIDSSGLGALVRMLTKVRKNNGDIKLCEAPQRVRRVMEITLLHKQFQIHDTEAAALAAFGERAQSAPAPAATEGPEVLCLHDSVDMLAYLKSLLTSAGYHTVITTSPADADVFMKMGKTKLILLGAGFETIHGKSVVARFKSIAPSVPVHVLTAEFAAQEPGEAGPALLEKIRGLIP